LASGPPPGLIVWAGEVGPPLKLPARPASAVLFDLGMTVDRTQAGDPSKALASFAAGGRAYWEQGDLPTALVALERAMTEIPARVASPAAREQLAQGLWLLAMLRVEFSGDPKSAAVVLQAAVELAPELQITVDKYPAPLVHAFQQIHARYVRTARRLTVVWGKVAADDTCLVEVNGEQRGPVGRALGPLPAATYGVVLACGDQRSLTRLVAIGDDDVVVSLRSFDRYLTVHGTRLAMNGDAAAIGALRSVAGTWLLTVHGTGPAALEGRLYRGGDPESSGPMSPDALKAWVVGRVTPPDSSRSVWPWVLVGTGGALAAGAVATHVLAVDAADDINNHGIDRVAEFEALEPAYIGLYVAGGLVTAAGVAWLLLSTDSGDISATVAPAPGGLLVIGRF